MPKTLINKDGEAWCPSCGTVYDDAGKTLRAGSRPHGASCPNVAIDMHGNIRSAAYVEESPAADEVA